MTNSDTNNETSCFRAPYSCLSSEEVLSHFQQRENIHYFPVIDEDESTRKKIDNILLNRFAFNHETYQLTDHFDWTINPSQDIEWLILLHKFYYAVGLGVAFHETKDQRYVEKWVDLTSSWIDTVPLNALPSDVTGRRIQNWIFAHYYFVTLNKKCSLSSGFYDKFITSIYHQVSHLCNNLTPKRNHRTIELYAIFLAAVVFPELKNSDAWLTFSKEELMENIRTDLLADGVHCEQSTDYHHIVLKNYLGIRKLALLNDIEMPEEMDILIRKGLYFSMYVHKPDGFIPSLSDGDSQSFLFLLQQGYELYGDEAMLYVASQGQRGKPPENRSKAFPYGGYYVMRSGWGGGLDSFEDERYLVFDCGPLGEGAHGHLDLLSIEAAAYGKSLIVDPGRYTYDQSGQKNWRMIFRGTGYHNTIQIDKKNQIRYVYDSKKRRFRKKGPEPDRELKKYISLPGFDYLHGIARSHEYEAVHERKIFFSCQEYWIISDILRAQEVHDYDLFFHLSDQAFRKVFVVVKHDTVQIDAPHLVIAQAYDPEVKLTIEDGYVSRVYGEKHEAPVVRFSRGGANASFHTILYPYKSERPEITMEVLPVLKDAHTCFSDQTFALCITITRSGKQFRDYYFSADFSEAIDATRHYTFQDFSYNGSLLYFRQDFNGKIFNIRGDKNSVLTERGFPVSMLGAENY